MKIVSNHKPKETAQVEGIVMAEVKKIALEPLDSPKNCVFHFSVPGAASELEKRYPLTFEDGSLLRKDLEIIMGRSLTDAEVKAGCDVAEVQGKKVPAVVMLRSIAGGKLAPAIGPVFALKSLKDTVAALE